ncbi:MAG: hypothetical protein F6K30_13880 [Cyanothece sp. SIO2G6]|nr:hypothetical protein [Cyanothece sp. SIO2G6]
MGRSTAGVRGAIHADAQVNQRPSPINLIHQPHLPNLIAILATNKAPLTSPRLQIAIAPTVTWCFASYDHIAVTISDAVKNNNCRQH